MGLEDSIARADQLVVKKDCGGKMLVACCAIQICVYAFITILISKHHCIIPIYRIITHCTRITPPLAYRFIAISDSLLPQFALPGPADLGVVLTDHFTTSQLALHRNILVHVKDANTKNGTAEKR